MHVNNSNDVWWIDHPQLINGKDYIVETIANQTHQPDRDGYNRLKLTFLKIKKDIFKRFQQIKDNINRKTLSYYLTFGCGTRYDKEKLFHKSDIVVDFEGII